MDPAGIRALVSQVNFTAFGMSVTITRPAPDHAPIAASGFWLDGIELQTTQPYGTDLLTRERRRVLAIQRSTVPTLPRGTRIAAPDRTGGAARTWVVDGLEQVESDHWRATVTPV